MRNYLVTLPAAGALALGAAAPAPAQHAGGHGGHGMGGLMKALPSPHMGIDMMRELGLDEDQVTAITEIQRRLRSEHAGMKADLRKVEWRLRKELDKDRPDPERVQQLFGQLFDTRQQMIRGRVEAANRIQGTLSAEQRTRYREMGDPMCSGGMCRGGHGKGHGKKGH